MALLCTEGPRQMPGQEKDAVLVRRSVEGDERAFVALIRRYEQPLTTLIRHQIDGADHAEDVWQETLLVVWNSLGQLRDPSNVRSWLMQIARNRCRAFYRSKQRRDLPTEAYTLNRMVTRHGEQAARRREAMHEVTDIIETAPRSERGILKLFYIEGFTIAEIAARHRLPSGTVKRRLHTARQHLRKSMGIPLATRRADMTAPRRTSTRHPFPDHRPEINITPLAGESFSVDCRELRWWHIVPEVGDHTLYATYDAPDWALTQTTELRATGPARVHDAKGVKIEVTEWVPDPASTSHGEILTMYGRLAEDEAQWLAVVDRNKDREKIFTFLDENWKSQWGSPSQRLIADEGLFVEQAPGVFETATQATLESGAGCFSVEVAGNSFHCLRVFDHDLFDDFGAGEEGGLLIEAYLTREGRALLLRRYNGRLQVDDGKVPWDEELPDSPRIVIDGMTYVHWYDQIHARVFAA